MSKKKAVTIFFAIFSSLLLISGCSGSDGVSGSGEKTIEFMHLWPEGSSKQHNEIVKEIVADFEADNPDVKVKLEVLSNEQYKDKIKVLSTSNELPDVGMTWAAGYLEPYVDGKKFAPLDDLLEGDLKDSFVSGIPEAYEIEGSTYGLPLELNMATVFYNKKIFEENGLEAPKTYEEFQDAVETLAKNGVAPIALGNKDRWTGSLWYMYFADRIGGGDVLTNAINRSSSFTDPALVSAAEEVQNLVDKDAFVKGFNGLSDEEAKSMFMNEQAAMYLIATWDLPNYTTNEDVPQEFRDSVGYFPFPTVDGKGETNSYVGGPGVGLFVAEDSDVKEEAKDFTAFFVKEWGEKSVTEAGVIPATKVDAASLDLPDMYVDVLDDLNNASNITLFADVQMNADVAQTHLDMIQSLFGKEVTPEEFAEKHEEALSK
ncbi:ABC transporter substrate-binding protein [Terribacillus saccharophilus]|uniref:extracellular solute-binding protein n=1 Tax=Terribacillus saccharophilus TaxID=361277 RepID=UPI000BA69316|nr:extracellular solute-binding protein [Terribacillus saccharophilus]PAF19270.1 ABC transporter substrate-binding protein [Terribacillus saccharophilus]PAF22362.1 ABC transporter substrate-binding protein [Terribacillus saccharophilus]PAF38553.1 ABC transporter substrate-binding protein [Terribacillus saccharophilus]